MGLTEVIGECWGAMKRNLGRTAAVLLASAAISCADDHDCPSYAPAPAPATVIHTAGSTEVSEEGSTSDSYDVVLDSQPSEDVTVDVAYGFQLTGDKASLLFTPANWNIPQTVTVTAVDDAFEETNPHTAKVYHSMTSLDGAFNSKSFYCNVSILENDGAFRPPAPATFTESGGSTEVSEEGSTSDSYDVVLDHQPSDDVTVALSSGSQVSIDKASLLFTPLNWDVPQTVTVTAIDDMVEETNPHAGNVNHAFSSADYRFNNKLRDLGVSVLENDGAFRPPAPATVIHTGGSTEVSEEGPTSDSYNIVLDHQPSGDVTFTITSDAQVSADKASLLFTPLNWDVAQTVTVTAVDDSVKESTPHSGNVHHELSSSDYRFNNKDLDVIVSILDNEGVAQVRGRIAATRASNGLSDFVRQMINPDGSGKSEVQMADNFAPVGWSWDCNYLGMGGRTSLNYYEMMVFNGANALLHNLTDDTNGSHVEWHPFLYNLVVPTEGGLKVREWVLGDPSVDTPSTQVLMDTGWGWYFYVDPQYSHDGMKVAFVKLWSSDSGSTYTNLDILVGDYAVPLTNVQTVWSGSCQNKEPVYLDFFQSGSDYAVTFTEGATKQLHMVTFDGSNNFLSEQSYSLSDFTWRERLNFSEGPRCNVSSDGNLAVVVDHVQDSMPSASDPNKAVVFDLNTGIREATILGNTGTYFRDACFGPDSRMLLLGGASIDSYTITGGFLTILDYQTGDGKTIDAPVGKEIRFIDWGDDTNTYTFELPETPFPGSTYQ